MARMMRRGGLLGTVSGHRHCRENAMQSSTTLLRKVGVTVAAIIMAGTATAQQPPADLVVTNATVITLDAQRPQATAFAVKDGTPLPLAATRDGGPARCADPRHRCWAYRPGPNACGARARVRGGRFYNLELRWDGVDLLARGLAMIREQATRTPQGHWVRTSAAGHRTSSQKSVCRRLPS